MTIKYAAGIKYSASKVAPMTPPAIAIAKGGQNSPPPNNRGTKPIAVVNVGWQ